MNENMEFSSSCAVFILLSLLPIFTAPTSIASSQMENVCDSARFLENSVNTEWRLYDADGFSEYDFCNVICTTEECKAAGQILKDSMDPQTNPCDDFYQYACGNWPKNKSAIDPSISFNSIKLRDIQNDKEIMEFLEQNNTDSDPEAVRKARQFYSNCMNQASYQGTELLKDTLLNIGLPKTPHFKNTSNSDDAYSNTMAKTNKIAGNSIFKAIVGVNPYNHDKNAIWILKPYNSYVLLPIEASDKITPQSESMKEMNFSTQFETFCKGGPRTVKIDVLKQITEQEMIIGKASTIFSSSFQPNVFTLKELQNITDNIGQKTKSTIPKFNWTRYLDEIFKDSNVNLDIKNDSNIQIVITDMQYIRDKMEFMHTQTDCLNIERLLWCHVVGSFLPYTQFRDFQKTYEIPLNASQKEVCSAITTKSFSMAVSYMYSKKEKYISAKIQIENMVKYMKESYQKILEQATWMDQEIREKAVKKLASMSSFIAYPDSTELSQILNESYSNINVTSNFLASIMSVIQNQVKVNLGKLNQIYKKWTISPTNVNAYHNPLYNSITIPAALLGPPLYTDSLKSLIYGLIGSIVGHEISHGFDHSNGRKFNSEGILENWWNNKTYDAYEEKSKCFLKAYENYTSTFQGIHQKGNSTLTLDEDISDNAGFKAALFAYRNYISVNGDDQSLHDFGNLTSDQLFVLGFANFLCESPTNAISSMTPTLAHSPNGVRVNGVLKNSAEFASIWNCPKGTKMNPSDEKCSLF